MPIIADNLSTKLLEDLANDKSLDVESITYAKLDIFNEINHALETCRHAPVSSSELNAIGKDEYNDLVAKIKEATSAEAKIALFELHRENEAYLALCEYEERKRLVELFSNNTYWETMRSRCRNNLSQLNHLFELQKFYQPHIQYALYNIDALLYTKKQLVYLLSKVNPAVKEAQGFIAQYKQDDDLPPSALLRYLYRLEKLQTELYYQKSKLNDVLKHRLQLQIKRQDQFTDDSLFALLRELDSYHFKELNSYTPLTNKCMDASQRGRLMHAVPPLDESKVLALVSVPYTQGDKLSYVSVPAVLKKYIPAKRPFFFSIDKAACYNFFFNHALLTQLLNVCALQNQVPNPFHDGKIASKDYSWTGLMWHIDNLKTQRVAVEAGKKTGIFSFLYKRFNPMLTGLSSVLKDEQVKSFTRALIYIDNWFVSAKQTNDYSEDELKEISIMLMDLRERLGEAKLGQEMLKEQGKTLEVYQVEIEMKLVNEKVRRIDLKIDAIDNSLKFLKSIAYPDESFGEKSENLKNTLAAVQKSIDAAKSDFGSLHKIEYEKAQECLNKASATLQREILRFKQSEQDDIQKQQQIEKAESERKDAIKILSDLLDIESTTQLSADNAKTLTTYFNKLNSSEKECFIKEQNVIIKELVQQLIQIFTTAFDKIKTRRIAESADLDRFTFLYDLLKQLNCLHNDKTWSHAVERIGQGYCQYLAGRTSVPATSQLFGFVSELRQFEKCFLKLFTEKHFEVSKQYIAKRELSLKILDCMPEKISKHDLGSHMTKEKILTVNGPYPRQLFPPSESLTQSGGQRVQDEKVAAKFQQLFRKE